MKSKAKRASITVKIVGLQSRTITEAHLEAKSRKRRYDLHSSGGDAAETGSAKPCAWRSANPCVRLGDV